MESAFVIGGAGFIGSHLVDRLLAEGIAVDVVDDYSTGSLGNLASARALNAGLLKVHQLDARDPGLVELIERRRPNVVYHVALLAPGEEPAAAATAAIPALLNVLHGVRAVEGCKIVVALCGVALFGDVSARDLPIKEGRPFTPTSLCGVMNRTVIDVLQVYRDEAGVEFTALVMSNVYGPRQRSSDGVVAAFVAAHRSDVPASIFGDGRQTRDLLFIDDAVDALVRSGSRANGLVVNVSTGEQTSIRDLAHIVSGVPATLLPSRRHDVSRFALSPVRARIHLQWSAWTTVRSGVSATIEAVDATH